MPSACSVACNLVHFCRYIRAKGHVNQWLKRFGAVVEPQREILLGASYQMQPLAYTTSIESWPLLSSAIRLIRSSKGVLIPIDLNIDAPAGAILCCSALEAFANEISSLTSAFSFNQDRRARYSTATQQGADIGMMWSDRQAIAQIKDDPKGSFYDRYKALLKAGSIEQPNCMQSLSYLRDLRNAFSHFRACDMPIVEDSEGVICCAQEPPKVFAHLRSDSAKVCGWPVVAVDAGAVCGEWALRVSTNAMAAWSLSLTLEAILHVLDLLPSDEYGDFILRKYAARDVAFSTVFAKGKTDVEEWKNGLFLAS